MPYEIVTGLAVTFTFTHKKAIERAEYFHHNSICMHGHDKIDIMGERRNNNLIFRGLLRDCRFRPRPTAHGQGHPRVGHGRMPDRPGRAETDVRD